MTMMTGLLCALGSYTTPLLTPLFGLQLIGEIFSVADTKSMDLLHSRFHNVLCHRVSGVEPV